MLAAPKDVTRASKALRAAALAEELRISFHVSEWVDDEGDPAEVIALVATKQWLGVELVEVGSRPDEVATAMTEILGVDPAHAARVIGADWGGRPKMIMRGATRVHCELALRLLRQHGATVRIRSEDGSIEQT